MKSFIYSLITFLILVYTPNLKAENLPEKVINWLAAPDYVNMQYAGNLGLGAVGISYNSVDGKKNYGLSYGYLPSSVNHVEVHTISAKATISLYNLKITNSSFLNGYLGSNLIYSITDNTHLKFPGYYPANYYITNALHLAPFIGVKAGTTTRKKITNFLFFELGIIDHFLINSIRYEDISITDHLNLCMGISLPLR